MIRPTETERELAWLGDAVLTLFARAYSLHEGLGMNPLTIAAMTSNQILSWFGNPTKVEAELGRIYADQGLPAAFTKIETDLLPLFLKQWKKREKLS